MISLLNAFTGLAVAASGVVLGNVLLLVAGTLVGASGTILTKVMASAMGRGVGRNHVRGVQGRLDGGFHRPERPASTFLVPGGHCRPARLRPAVVIVPGYGLAVAQGQHAVAELATALVARGVDVVFAIHPVAGRMPGHMNVLLAEADVPYESLRELAEVNPEFATTDIVLVVGANDVVNPAAKSSPGSPIYGMPILEVVQAQQVVFLKRSMRPGFAGIENELLHDPRPPSCSATPIRWQGARRGQGALGILRPAAQGAFRSGSPAAQGTHAPCA